MLTQQIASGGTTPWCIGLESGSASGWPGSDWVKEIVLSQSGPDVYDRWVNGQLKWSSPEIKQAFQTWGSQILGANASNVYGGKQYIDRKSTRLNSSHSEISYAVFCLKQ